MSNRTRKTRFYAPDGSYINSVHMSSRMRKTYKGVAWGLTVALFIITYLGFCSPDKALKLPADEGSWTAWQSLVYWLGQNYSYFFIASIVMLLFCLIVLPLVVKSVNLEGKKKSGFRVFWKALPLTTFMLPGALVMFFFNYLPLPGIVLAFKSFKKARGSIFNTIATSAWTGLKNFSFINTPTALSTIRNTFMYNFGWMILGLVLAVAVAIMLSLLRNKRAVKIYQTGIFMPYFLSWVIAAYLLYAMLNHEKGLIGSRTAVDLYLTPSYWPMLLTLCNVWKYLGYNSIVYTASIAGIDSELYEAATLDGASTWQKVKYITLPMLKPIMIVLTIMAMGRMANADFGLFYNLPMNSGPLTTTTDVFDTYVFRMLNQGKTNLGVTAAASLFQSVLGFILIFSSNMIVRKVSPDNSLF